MEGSKLPPKFFSLGKTLQKCSPRSLLKVTLDEEMWKRTFHEHEDSDLFVQVFNRGVRFHGQRLQARSWVFLYTPKGLWEEVERLADAATEITVRAFELVTIPSRTPKVAPIGATQR